MSSIWIEKRKRWRLREETDGKRLTVVDDLGIWKDPAHLAKVDYKKARARGFVRDLTSTDVMRDVRIFLKAYDGDQTITAGGREITMTQFCDLYHEHHGPSLKGGVSKHWRSPFKTLGYMLGVVKRSKLGAKIVSTVNRFDVRDFLSQFETIGTRMRYLAILIHMFNSADEWNEEKIVNPPISLPAQNPAKKWRSKMKSADKRCQIDKRVLSHEEWAKFKPHLTKRALAISEVTLRRFLRLADIKQISHLKIKDGMIEGLQEKTGEPFSVPILESHPSHYDFTNFRKEFHAAQVAVGMDYPKGHPLYFTPRTLRRTGATWAWLKTRDLVGISKMLGHSRIETTIRYLNIDKKDLTAIAQAVDKMASGGEPVGKAPETADPVGSLYIHRHGL